MKTLTFCAFGRAEVVPSMALQTDFSKHSMNATKFLVYLRLFNSPSSSLVLESSFKKDIESRAQDFIPPKILFNKY